jgi:sec-independent protein translocase protein TatA
VLGNLSASEIVILMLIVLLVFGAGRLPEAGKAVGKGLREFRRALGEAEDSIRRLPDDEPPPAAAPGRDAKPKRLVE